MTGKGGDAIRSPRWLSIEDRSLQEIYESVRELLLETLNEDEGWKGLTRDDISVEPLSGGITNKMFKCEPPKPLTPVVTRVCMDRPRINSSRERTRARWRWR